MNADSPDGTAPKRPPEVPPPAHPSHRREPLPHERPKAKSEDQDAPARVATILHSPSYQLADNDADFLHREDTRALRLHVDYLKPELLLREHGIEHTIVVFGSTRVTEPAAAARRLRDAEQALAADPDSAERARDAKVAQRIVQKSHYYEVARQFGRLVGEAGAGSDDNRIVVATGGGPGIMEAANRGAHDVGAKSIGYNIDLPHEQFPNPYITPELCFRFHYFALRKLHFLMRAKALVVFPGGYGTLDELFETLALVQTRKIAPVPVALVGEAYWRGFCNIDYLVDEGVIDPEDRDLFWFAETAEHIWDGIRHWHEQNNAPLQDDDGK